MRDRCEAMRAFLSFNRLLVSFSDSTGESDGFSPLVVIPDADYHPELLYDVLGWCQKTSPWFDGCEGFFDNGEPHETFLKFQMDLSHSIFS